MPLSTEKPNIISLFLQINPDRQNDFIDWQADFNTEITNIPGFISLECSLFDDHKKHWTIVQRFIDSDAAYAWFNSAEYKELMEKLKAFTYNQEIKAIESYEFNGKGNITEVIVTKVNAGMEKDYRVWSAKIHRIEAQFPGFRGVYVQSPRGKDKHWITLLQFDTMEHLDHWLQSPERHQVLKESSSMILSLESHRVVSPYAAWFSSIVTKKGELPSLFKQNMLILLGLFPIVVLEMKFLSPLLATVHPNLSLSTFISNMLSVALLSFPTMPIIIRLLNWWLSTHDLRITIAGTILVILLYLIEIALFWNFF